MENTRSEMNLFDCKKQVRQDILIDRKANEKLIKVKTILNYNNYIAIILAKNFISTDYYEIR